MKYSELDFKNGIVTFDLYQGYPEHLHFSGDILNQDMMTVDYGNFTIDLGWYETQYMIALIANNQEEWKPFYSVKTSNHEEIFNKFQEVINLSEKIYNLMVFS